VGGGVKIIAVVGTGSGCGKTTVACRILSAIPGLGAVKISPRDGASGVEWGAGEPGKDTDLFVKHGAIRVARIIGPRLAVPTTWEMIKGQFDGCPGVVIEGACALDIPGERYIVFVVGPTVEKGREERNRAIEAISDSIIERSSHFCVESLVEMIKFFLSCSKNS
jgi:hypothetical protein